MGSLHRMPKPLLHLLGVVALSIGAAYSSIPVPAPELPPPPAAMPVKDTLLRVPEDATTCYVDVRGRPEIALAGELGALLRQIEEGQKLEEHLVHPLHARVVVSRSDGILLLTFEYRDETQRDAAAPARHTLMPFLGIARTLFAQEKPHFILQTGLLIAWIGCR